MRFSINICKVILVYCTAKLSIEEHLLYKMDLVHKLYGVEASSASSEMVTCTREWTAFSLELWPLLYAGA